MEYDKFLIGSTDYRKNFRDGVMRGITFHTMLSAKGWTQIPAHTDCV